MSFTKIIKPSLLWTKNNYKKRSIITEKYKNRSVYEQKKIISHYLKYFYAAQFF